MTPREKISAAFSADGTPELAAVIPYEGIYYRDRLRDLTRAPWWWSSEPDLQRELEWNEQAHNAVGQDWIALPWSYSRDQRQRLYTEQRGSQVFVIDRSTGGEQELTLPAIGGYNSSGQVESLRPQTEIDDPDEIDRLIPAPDPHSARRKIAEGRDELTRAMLAGFASDLAPIYHVGAPLWRCYYIWGFEGMMTRILERPDLVARACERFTALSLADLHSGVELGAEVFWIEDSCTDQISASAFATLNLPYLIQIAAEARSLGVSSIYYFCGDPAGKWDSILDVGADAVALEESKKSFTIDIEDVVDRVGGRCAVLGNVDAVGVLQDGSDETLRRELERQAAAGRRNGGRFVMSLGSPVTPGTPPDRVRRYCEITHDLRT